MAMVTAFVLVNALPGRTAALAEELADVPSVAEVYSTAGDYDLVAVVRVRHHDELADVVTGAVARLDGVTRTRTLVAFDALWSLGNE
jgi:DNA-binding Lrp family transcriptional regulator